jgi:cytochrome c biogenesis protein CcmG/thiol:disulfide interchange protein DsbE
MRRLAVTLACVALLAVAGCDSGDEPKSAGAATKQELAGAPAPLAGLPEEANELLDGDFERRLEELRGFPVVVNKWASWCPPCRAEFPYFQSQARKRAKKVAFLGVNSNDNDGDARAFLDKYPVPFPSYKDPKLDIAAKFKAVQSFPATAFYDSRGKLEFVHHGGYPSEAELADDIDRYAR